jgi:hypothetical protein
MVACHCGNAGVLVALFCMSFDPIVDALKVAHSLVWENTPSTESDKVLQLRDLVHSSFVRSALERSSDSLPAFALREVVCALTDQSQTPGKTIARIRNVLDDPQLNEVLRFPQKRWIRFRPRPRNL